MDTGVLIALAFGVAIVLLAVLLGWLFPGRHAQRRFGRGGHDINASHADGRASATWIGIRAARGDGIDPDGQD